MCMIATLVLGHVADITVLVCKVSLGLYIWFKLIFRILGLLTATTAVVHLGLLELRDTKRWVPRNHLPRSGSYPVELTCSIHVFPTCNDTLSYPDLHGKHGDGQVRNSSRWYKVMKHSSRVVWCPGNSLLCGLTVIEVWHPQPDYQYI